MARIQCPQCNQTFRGEGGLNWHLNRIHAIDQQTSEVNPQFTNPCQDEVQDQPKLEDLCNTLELLQQRTDNIASSVGEFPEWMNAADKRIQDLEAKVSSLGHVSRQVQEHKTAVDDLRREISDQKTILVALCRLVWNLDQTHVKEPRGFNSLIVNLDQSQLSEAREVISDILSLGQPCPQEIKDLIDSITQDMKQ